MSRRGASNRLTVNERRVLHALRSFPAVTVAEMRSLNLPSSDPRSEHLNEATLYRILIRFTDAGFTTAKWQTDDPTVRPVRRFTITEAGRAAAASERPAFPRAPKAVWR
jgi:hypothetical protein